MIDEEARHVARLIKSINYLIGIAERGEGRLIRASETPEQFVEGYVKKLETALRLAADEPNIGKARAIADAVLIPRRNQ